MAELILYILLRLLILGAAISGFILMKRNWARPFKLLVVLVSLDFLFETYMIYYSMTHASYHWPYNYWVVFESIIIIYFLSSQATIPWVRKFFPFYLVYLSVALWLSFWHQDPAVGRIYENLWLLFAGLILSCILIVDVLRRNDDVSIFRVPVFWVACGILPSTVLFTLYYAIPLKFLVVAYGWYTLVFLYGAMIFQYGGIIAGFVVYARSIKLSVAAPEAV